MLALTGGILVSESYEPFFVCFQLDRCVDCRLCLMSLHFYDGEYFAAFLRNN